MRARAFSVFTLLLLAIAIGSTTGIFSLLEALALRDLPVSHPEQLLQLVVPRPDDPESGLTVTQFREIERRQQVFSAMFGAESHFVGTIDIGGELSHVMTSFATGNFYDELGARPAAGRLITPEDDSPRGLASSVVVIGYDYWQRQFGGDVAILGRTIHLDGLPFVVVGIAPKHFSGIGLSEESDLTIPSETRYAVEVAAGADPSAVGPDFAEITAVGRLKTGVTLVQAAAQLESLWPAVKQATLPKLFDGEKRTQFLAEQLVVKSAANGADQLWRSSVTRPLWLAFAGALLILLIACVNLAGLALTRVAAGQREWTVRAALGASRWQMIRPLLIDCVILAGTAAACGFPIATGSVAAFRQWTVSAIFPTTSAISLAPDLRVLLFVTAVVLLVVVTVSTGAVVWLNRRRGELGLQAGARVSRQRLGPALLCLQVALSLVLISTSGLLAQNLRELRSTRDLHYRREGVTVLSLDPRPNGWQNLDNDIYQPQLAEKILAIPGVRAASFGDAPAPKQWDDQTVSRADAPIEVSATIGRVTPGFFKTLELPLLQGRDFSWRDNSKASRVAIISQSLAQHFFPTGDGVGQLIRVGTNPLEQHVEVIGVVADAKLYDFEHPTPLAVFTALLQDHAANYKDVLVRSDLVAWPSPIRSASGGRRVRP